MKLKEATPGLIILFLTLTECAFFKKIALLLLFKTNRMTKEERRAKILQEIVATGKNYNSFLSFKKYISTKLNFLFV